MKNGEADKNHTSAMIYSMVYTCASFGVLARQASRWFSLLNWMNRIANNLPFSWETIINRHKVQDQENLSKAGNEHELHEEMESKVEEIFLMYPVSANGQYQYLKIRYL